MYIIFLIIISYGAFLSGFACGKVKNEKNKKEKQELQQAKTSFRSPLRRYE